MKRILRSTPLDTRQNLVNRYSDIFLHNVKKLYPIECKKNIIVII